MTSLSDIPLFQATSLLKKFVDSIEGASFISAMTFLGDNQMKSAKTALAQFRSANDKKHAMWSVIPPLRDAHTAYRSIWKTPLKGISATFGPATFENACLKDAYVSCVFAACSVYLKEETWRQEGIRWALDAIHTKDAILDDIGEDPISGVRLMVTLVSGVTVDLPAMIENNKLIKFNEEEVQTFGINLQQRLLEM